MLQLLKPRPFFKDIHVEVLLWTPVVGFSFPSVLLSSRLCCCEVLTVPTAPLGPWRAPLTTATPAMETSPSKEWPLWAAVCGSSVWLCSKRIQAGAEKTAFTHFYIFSSSAFLFLSVRPGRPLQPLTPTHTALESKGTRNSVCIQGTNRVEWMAETDLVYRLLEVGWETSPPQVASLNQKA